MPNHGRHQHRRSSVAWKSDASKAAGKASLLQIAAQNRAILCADHTARLTGIFPRSAARRSVCFARSTNPHCAFVTTFGTSYSNVCCASNRLDAIGGPLRADTRPAGYARKARFPLKTTRTLAIDVRSTFDSRASTRRLIRGIDSTSQMRKLRSLGDSLPSGSNRPKPAL
jgi:hypothetical protein